MGLNSVWFQEIKGNNELPNNIKHLNKKKL